MADVDNIAAQVANLARIARSMNPFWELGRRVIPVLTVDGGYLGELLPGKGLYLDSDLKYAGIYKQIPHVYEKSLFRKIYEKVKNDRVAINLAGMILGGLVGVPTVMGAITKYDDILNAFASGLNSDWECVKNSVTGTSGQWSTIARATGVPGAISYTNIPGGSAFDQTSTGAFTSVGLDNPFSGKKGYLIQVGVQTGTTSISYALLVDLLVAAGNISTTVTTAQTVNSTALTRYTNGNFVEMVFDVTTALGATGANITVSYTNQAGTAGQTTPAQALLASSVTAKLMPQALGPFTQLASGDFGIRSVQSVTISANMAAGVLALNLFYPLAIIPGVASNAYIEKDLPLTFESQRRAPP